MKHGYLTLDMEDGFDNGRVHKVDVETFKNEIANAKAILAKVGRCSHLTYYSACFPKANNNYSYNRCFIKFRS
ncbi:hypothetical protein [Acetobacterium bakii]|uniref:Uncharacterized protein n=1 Tax=Acetobacterium bakii TaxID=52689 RepID=A0A0L6U159_9FIRM|nr:hypothetical protein [Acetobacterium bakii]KNZ42082.1 hypothetical protein AKG39_08610 [Acetobacterium bakii]